MSFCLTCHHIILKNYYGHEDNRHRHHHINQDFFLNYLCSARSKNSIQKVQKNKDQKHEKAEKTNITLQIQHTSTKN